MVFYNGPYPNRGNAPSEHAPAPVMNDTIIACYPLSRYPKKTDPLYMSSHSNRGERPRRSAPRVFFYVQHLLGAGHLRRAVLLADGMRRTGMEVHLVSGGARTPGLPEGVGMVQLPPLRAKDPMFSALVDASGREPGRRWLEERCRLLLAHYRRIEPDIVVIESFPFGRRKLRFELMPLLDEVRRTDPEPCVACSVRDIVQARKPERIEETVALVNQRFACVLVHGDPRLVRFDESFPAAHRIGDKIVHTGLVASTAPPGGSTAGTDEVLVSGGGGAVSVNLLAAAIDARSISSLSDSTWRILAGPNIDEAAFNALGARAPRGVVVERNRPDFRSLLGRCRISVSQCGYNTAIELIQSRARAIVVPFESVAETEQLLRAGKLEAHGLAAVLREKDLSPESLAAAVDRCVSGPAPSPPELDLGGAEASARHLLEIWNSTRARR